MQIDAQASAQEVSGGTVAGASLPHAHFSGEVHFHTYAPAASGTRPFPGEADMLEENKPTFDQRDSQTEQQFNIAGDAYFETSGTPSSAAASNGQQRSAQNNILISHIDEEAALAQSLKDLLEKLTDGFWKAFVRTSLQCVSPGNDWLATIEGALREHEVLLVLCSPDSVQRFWIGYETGCSVGKSVHVGKSAHIIPICHSGATPSSLPPFLSRYQGLTYGSASFIKTLFRAIHKYIPLDDLPDLPDEEGAARAGGAVAASAPAVRPTATPARTPAEGDIGDPDCREMLRLLASATGGRLSLRLLTGYLGLLPVQVHDHGEALKRNGLIRISMGASGDKVYTLTGEWQQYMADNGIEY
jgi:hypothetical protein